MDHPENVDAVLADHFAGRRDAVVGAAMSTASCPASDHFFAVHNPIVDSLVIIGEGNKNPGQTLLQILPAAGPFLPLQNIPPEVGSQNFIQHF